MAVRGDLTAADSIGRAELSHRVLAGAAPDETAPARLAGEGVTFDDAGRPDPARRVSWDELARRAATTTERRHEPSREPGLLPCIAVDSIDEVLQAMPAAGGEVVQPRTPIVAGNDWEARFRDPAGNVLGLYEQAEG